MNETYQSTPRCEICDYELVREITEFRNGQVIRVDQIQQCKKCGRAPNDPVVIWRDTQYETAQGYDPNGLSGLKQQPYDYPETESEHGVIIQ